MQQVGPALLVVGAVGEGQGGRNPGPRRSRAQDGCAGRRTGAERFAPSPCAPSARDLAARAYDELIQQRARERHEARPPAGHLGDPDGTARQDGSRHPVPDVRRTGSQGRAWRRAARWILARAATSPAMAGRRTAAPALSTSRLRAGRLVELRARHSVAVGRQGRLLHAAMRQHLCAEKIGCQRIGSVRIDAANPPGIVGVCAQHSRPACHSPDGQECLDAGRDLRVASGNPLCGRPGPA